MTPSELTMRVTSQTTESSVVCQIMARRRRLLAEGIRVETSIKATSHSASAMANKLTAAKWVFLACMA